MATRHVYPVSKSYSINIQTNYSENLTALRLCSLTVTSASSMRLTLFSCLSSSSNTPIQRPHQIAEDPSVEPNSY